MKTAKWDQPIFAKLQMQWYPIELILIYVGVCVKVMFQPSLRKHTTTTWGKIPNWHIHKYFETYRQEQGICCH